jgi:antitoxin component YwqK of YwqJK toxin-antitoxin module
MTSDLTEFFDEDMHEIEHQVDESEIEYGVNGSELEYERKSVSALQYRIFENGKLLERLNTGECYENIEWESTIHHVEAEQIGNIEEWVEKIFIENDALEPSIEFMNLVGYWMHKPGDKITMYYTGGNIERCDFITL